MSIKAISTPAVLKTQQDQLLVELASFNYSSGEGGGVRREWHGGEESGMGEEESGIDGEGSGINGDWLGEGGNMLCNLRTYL